MIKIMTKRYSMLLQLVKKSDCNTKIKELKNKISSITDLVTTFTLNSKHIKIKSKTPDTRSLIKKTDYDKNIKEIEDNISDHCKYITTLNFNKLNFNKILIFQIIDAKIKRSNLITKAAVHTKVRRIEKKTSARAIF